MNRTPATVEFDLAAERITDAVLGLGAIAVFVMTLVMYLTA